MKRTYLSILLCLTGLALYAANPGETCRTAIPLTKDYSETITKVGIEKWYSAWTFDLPLSVAFVPDDGESAPAPIVEMDFSCTSGYYEDSILCSLFCKTSGSSGLDMKMPHTPSLVKGKKDGKFAYTLSLGKRYRDLLLQMGISYNLAVYVKVTYKSTGVLTMLPDEFSNCMDEQYKFMHFGDTVHVAAKDKDRHVIVPYVQWQEDTVVYTWTGTAPCRLRVAYICDFDPTDDEKYGNIMVQSPTIQPGASVKAKAEDISSWVHNEKFPPQAGMYFAKFYSEEPGVMKITKAPQAAPDGGATMLRFGMTYALNANPKTIYAIPRSWNVDVMFSSPTSHLFSMDISTTAKFAEGDILKTYSYEKTENGRWIGIPAKEMNAHWSKATGNHYLYIRFACTEATTITPDRWGVSDCYTNTSDRTVSPAETKTIKKTSKDVYRFSYPQWIGGNMYIKYTLNMGDGDCDIYIANTCGMNIDKANADYWLKYQATASTDAEPLMIPASEIASWAEKIDDEGNFYAIFYTNSNGTRKLTFTTDAPVEKDPEYPKSSIYVSCEKSDPYFEVSKAQTVIVKDANNAPVKNISAEPNQKYSLSDLSVGKYTLEGETEKISINL